MKWQIPVFLIIFSFLAQTLSAQFYTTGDDPASVRWSYMESRNFKVIYPYGLDSLARKYIMTLERYRLPVSGTAGYMPGEMTKVKMPVVLHAFNASSNGSVAWAPKRMDLFTSPPAYNPEPVPWTDMLGIHESRHVAQMQFGLSHSFRPFKYIFGEMFAGLTSGIFPDMWLLEGDAVVAETALSSSGRGRVSNFLNYYRIAFDNNDFRNVDRWAYGSYWRYTPDHYAFGYLAISGIRYLYDVPEFSGALLRHYARYPLDLAARNTVSKSLTGKKFRTAVAEVSEFYNEMWKEDMEDRAPFLPYTRISRIPGTHTEYSDNLIVGDNLYSLGESLTKSRRMVKIDSTGKMKYLGPFSGNVGMLYYSPVFDRIFWSETVPDVRWSQKNNSVIRYYDLKTGRKRSLTRNGRLFNPNPSPTEGHIAVTEYTDDGRSHLTILNGKTGEKEFSFDVPDSLQLLESAWADKTIYATALSSGGYGIYHLEICGLHEHDCSCTNDEEHPYVHDGLEYIWKETLSPSPVMIFNFGTSGEELMFTSDRTGTNELYQMDPVSGIVKQMTSTRYGAVDFTYSSDGKYLICSAADRTGAPLVRIRTDSLLRREVDFHERYVWKVAEKLSAQEKLIASSRGYGIPDTSATEISDPKRYRKFPHLFNLHSWAPFYFNYDNIRNLSYDKCYELCSAGATALFQNRLGTFSSYMGYSAHKDPYNKGYWRHSGHVKLTYSGLYPVIEASLDFNDRASRISKTAHYFYGARYYMTSMSSYSTGTPLVSGNISMYIPFNLSSGGKSRGLIPQVSWNISNDRIDNSIYRVRTDKVSSETAEQKELVLYEAGKTVPWQSVSASIRYYTMRNMAHSEIYPDLGFGIEAGAYTTIGTRELISPSGYLYLYGYLPGITGNQGLKLSAALQAKLSDSSVFGSSIIDILPRGLSGNTDVVQFAGNQTGSLKFTADYAIPFWMGDFHIGNVFYVKRGIVTPHFDISVINGSSLWSAGWSLQFEFGNFLGFAFPIKCGMTYSYNGGGLYGFFEENGINLGRNFFGPVFSIDL